MNRSVQYSDLRFCHYFLALLAACLPALLLCPTRASAQDYSAPYLFSFSQDIGPYISNIGGTTYFGAPLTPTVILGTDGNFYGVNQNGTSLPDGSAASWGAVFKVAPSGQVTLLHVFQDGSPPNDGADPTSLIQAADGNFYGVTEYGGSTTTSMQLASGYGTVFRMTPAGQITILHSFGDGSVPNDGVYPLSLIQGTDGNFYGLTMSQEEDAGLYNGTVFKMTPSGTITILHRFADGTVGNDGASPNSPLVQGSDGNFYGTTFSGGYPAIGDGTVFKITPAGLLTILYCFSGKDGKFPLGGLVQGSDGDFYGTTNRGGSTYVAVPGPTDNWGYGTIFRITPAGVLTTLHSVGDGSVPNDGSYPYYTLAQGSDGNFYGVTGSGGTAGFGTVFKIMPTSTETVLHSFGDGSVPNDGIYPGYIMSAGDGNLYGTTQGTVGLDQGWVMFEVAMPPHLPLNLAATPDNSQIDLAWTASQTAQSYNVYRATVSGAETLYQSGVTGTSFADTAVANGATYYYEVTAVNSVGESSLSNEASATIAPSTPATLTAGGGNGQVSLSWSSSSGATSYNVYRATLSGAESLRQAGVSATTYKDTSVTNGTTYYYEVTGVAGAAESTKSNEASATPEPPVPSAPTKLLATAGNAQVGLSWAALAGASSYNVYRSTSSGAETLYHAGVAGTSYTDTGVTNGITYYYTVTAVNAGGESGKSNEVSATPQVPAPPAPLNLIATAGNAQVGLSWTASAGATSYNVYRSTTASAETRYQSGVSTTSTTDTGVTNGTTYYYEVTAVGAGGESAKSNAASAIPQVPPPAAPANLAATVNATQVGLSWAASAGATSYNVQRSTKSGWETLYQAGVTSTTYTDTGVTNGVTYYYKVSAGNAGGYGPLSNEVSATPKMPALPAAPTKLTATAGNTQVGLSWTADANAASYNLYRSGTTGTETLYVSSIVGTSFTDTGLTNGTAYFYKVKSVNIAGVSGYSNEASAKPHPPAPPAPTLTATGGVKQISLSWTASAGATSYRVYRARTSGGEALLVGGITTVGYVDKSVTVGVTYYYKVSAVNAYGVSPQSNEANAAASN